MNHIMLPQKLRQLLSLFLAKNLNSLPEFAFSYHFIRLHKLGIFSYKTMIMLLLSLKWWWWFENRSRPSWTGTGYRKIRPNKGDDNRWRQKQHCTWGISVASFRNGFEGSRNKNSGSIWSRQRPFASLCTKGRWGSPCTPWSPPWGSRPCRMPSRSCVTSPPCAWPAPIPPVK